MCQSLTNFSRSAVQGLAVVSPNITSSTIVGTSSGILIVLFALQPLGLTKLATTFAPIVILWLAFNASFGIYNLVKYDHSVLKAFSPYYAIHFFAEGKTEAWKMLGGILLSFTGVEALFADRKSHRQPNSSSLVNVRGKRVLFELRVKGIDADISF